METLNKKIDFAVVFKVKDANPNGDPLNGNRPRTDFEDYGEVSDVCLKRKIRNRLLDNGEAVFVQSDDYKKDDARSLKSRAEQTLGKVKDNDDYAKKACETWFDVRAFGQIFAIKADKKDKDSKGVSIGIRGPVSLHSAFSIEPVEIISTQITKSVNTEDVKDDKKGSDTMGMKHRVKDAVYVFYGSMNPQLAERTGFSYEDALKIKKVLPEMFENDASSARPDGSMEVLKVIWWEHNSKSGQYSSAKVHRTLKVNSGGDISLDNLEGLQPEIIEGK